MFKNRTFNALVGLTIVVLAGLSISTVAFKQPTLPVVNSSPLDWYFSHDHAIIDGDNAVVSSANIPVDSSPLDWYFGHDHAIIDGDNAMVSNVSIPVNSSPLDWYFSHTHAILDGDNNVVLVTN